MKYDKLLRELGFSYCHISDESLQYLLAPDTNNWLSVIPKELRIIISQFFDNKSIIRPRNVADMKDLIATENYIFMHKFGGNEIAGLLYQPFNDEFDNAFEFSYIPIDSSFEIYDRFGAGLDYYDVNNIKIIIYEIDYQIDLNHDSSRLARFLDYPPMDDLTFYILTDESDQIELSDSAKFIRKIKKIKN